MKNAAQSSCISTNGAIIQQRWPALFDSLIKAGEPREFFFSLHTPQSTLVINGIHLSSAYDQVSEAELQASLVPGGSRCAWIYGIGTGQVPCVLLRRQEMEKMVVVIMNPDVAVQSFRYFDHAEWLSDSRVELSLAENEKDVNYPFAAIPSCLQLACNSAARLRDLVFLELATPFIQSAHQAKNGETAHRIRENMSYIQSDGDVAELFGTRSGETIVVAAAGPTLVSHYPWFMEKKGNQILIAVDAALKPLVTAGIIPDVVVTIDAHREGVLPFFEGIDHALGASIQLVYFPIVHGDVLHLWPGRRLTAYSHSDVYKSVSQANPKGILFSSGSVLHSALDLAVKIGASKVILLGADFSFPDGKTHVAGSPVSREKQEGITHHWVLNGHGKRVATSANLRWYLRDLEKYIARYPHIHVINGSREGARIEGTSYLEIK